MTANEKTQAANDRWHGLSALRAVAMLLGITLHAAIPYLSRPMKGVTWTVQESPSMLCDIAFWWVHAWRLPLFFFLAGLFARLTHERYGVMDFGERRLRRLAVPYIVACLTIGPIIYLVFASGWYLTGQCTFLQMLPNIPFPQRLEDNIFGPVHLWFLQDLIILTALYFYLAVCVSSGEPKDRQVSNSGPVPWWIPLVASIPCALLLWSDLSPFLRFSNTFLVDPPRLLYYALYFIGGVAAYRNREWFLEAIKHARIHLLLSLPLSALLMWLLRTDAIDVQSLIGRLVMGITTALVAWLTIYGLIGWFVHGICSEPPVVQYVADSSYWMYLCHFPIVAAIHVAMHRVEAAPELKFFIASLTTTVIGFASYQRFVRYTIIGNYLHGPRRRPSVEHANSDAQGATTA